jgi:hypothetical protein
MPLYAQNTHNVLSESIMRVKPDESSIWIVITDMVEFLAIIRFYHRAGSGARRGEAICEGEWRTGFDANH